MPNCLCHTTTTRTTSSPSTATSLTACVLNSFKRSIRECPPAYAAVHLAFVFELGSNARNIPVDVAKIGKFQFVSRVAPTLLLFMVFINTHVTFYGEHRKSC